MNLSREVFKTQEQIAERVAALGREITDHYKGEEISLLGVLKGSFIFLADLARQIRLPAQIGFLEIVTSRKSEFLTEVVFSSSFPIEGSHLLVVEHILDTGVTLAYLTRSCSCTGRGRSGSAPSSTSRTSARSICSRITSVSRVPDRHMVGYGLDLAGKHRNLPHLTWVE